MRPSFDPLSLDSALRHQEISAQWQDRPESGQSLRPNE
jgi:hypothetical protein